MTTVIDAILEQFTNTQELYIRTSNTEGREDGWQTVDTLRFMRQMKLQQEIRFAEYWLPRAQKRLETQRGWLKHWLRARNGDEISENNYRASKAQAQAEHHTVLMLETQLQEAQAAYVEKFGDNYTTAPATNVLPPEEAPEIDATEAAELKALGIDT